MSESQGVPAVGAAFDWGQHWADLDMPWRTEPEIDDERKAFLRQQLRPADDDGQASKPVLKVRQLGDRVSLKTANAKHTALDDPFANVPLTRADLEWLLATHDGGKGPVIWDEPAQRQREGVNLRGAHLAGVDLSGLPMARTFLTDAHLEQSSLFETHLEGADIERAHFEGANLAYAYAHSAQGMGVNLQGAILYDTQAQEASLRLAHFEAADLRLAHFEKASLRNAHFAGADLRQAHFEGADCTSSFFAPSVDPGWEQLRARIPKLPKSLEGADLRGVFFDSATALGSQEGGSVFFNMTDHPTGVQLADVHWGDVNIATIPWGAQLPGKGPLLGDELAAWKLWNDDSSDALQAMVASVRASRQLAVQLRDQGLNEEADRFAYRAQYCQKHVLWKQKRWGGYALSQALDTIAGYGYQPLRTLYTYLATIAIFAGLYLLASHFTPPHLSWDEAIVLSMSSFHGRGFFNQNVLLGDAFARLAAFEALIGLLIEVSFIATFTQRFLGK